jgi:RimJ/RimL family protein N-acetyltransferase
MLFRVKVVLESPRLALRELTADDLNFVAEMLAYPEVMRFWPRPLTRPEAADWIRRQQERYARDGFGYWLALDKTTGQPIGQAGLLRQELDGVVETGIGYILHRPFWGQGYATEAAADCRDYAFTKLGKIRVTATVRPENLASRRVAERIELKFERMTTWAGLPHLLFAALRCA